MNTALVLALCILLAGCDVLGPGDKELDGRWSGHIESDGSTIAVSVDIDENSEREILGSGSIGSHSVMVDGSRTGDRVALTLSAPTFNDMSYIATLDGDDELTGTVSGSGFSGETLILRRR